MYFINNSLSITTTFEMQVAISRFDTDRYLPYEKLQQSIQIVRKKWVAQCSVLELLMVDFITIVKLII